MLTNNLQETLNKKWKNCWPVSDLRPLALLDLISYLFFIKKADDENLIHKKIKTSGIDHFVYSPEIENFTWSNLQNLNAGEIHQLFTKEKGLIDLMNHYEKINASYSNYFKAPLLIEPTPKLLFNAIEIVNIIETNDQATRENIVEYLFTKYRNTGKNYQAILPAHILKLIISLAEPVRDDIIFDPAAHDGNLLLGAYKHIQSSNSSLVNPAISQNTQIKISGCEPDGVYLRIAAMNLRINGITDPNTLASSFNQTAKEKPSLIISSLLSSDDTEATPESDNIGFSEREAAILNDITESLGIRGRAVVLVQKDLLQSELPAIVTSRKKIVDQNNLEAVLTLDSKNDSLYAGAAILVFNKSGTTSKDIWFYKWMNSKKKNSETLLNDDSGNTEFEEVSYILDKWKIRKEQPAISSPNSFFISANYVRSNNYNLSFNDYKLVKQQQLPEHKSAIHISGPSETVIAAKKENLHEFFEDSSPLPVEKQKRKLAPILLIILIIICAAFGFYWVYSKDNKSYFSGKPVNPGNTASVSNNLVSFNAKPGDETNTHNIPGTKYTVINKAWFHSDPDSGKIKPVYIIPRKDLIVISRAEEKGFVYVIYTNHKGESTHGWLDKNDLHPVE